MPNGVWVGESSSSGQPRDSRVVSIYEKYLYDPKDLESTDPRRRELARKASQLKLQGQPANNMHANGVRPQQPPTQQQRKSIAFRQGTKPLDGRTAAAGLRGPVAQNTTVSSRDSGAFGLGLGMLGGGGDSDDSESDSDSGNRPTRSKVASPGLDRLKKANSPQRPESWSDRAAAVGQRPPDSASQNPPSLKLMALKSAKQGGDIPVPQQQQRHDSARQSLRHGSTIAFAAPPIDKHISARIALTKQLGLAPPSPTRPEDESPRDNHDQRSTPKSGGPTPPRQIAVPPPIDIRRAQQPMLNSNSPSGAAFQSPMGSGRSYGSSPNSATPLRSGPGMPPPNVLQRGPPSPYGQAGQPGPSPPHPAALRAGNGTVAPQRGNMPPPPLASASSAQPMPRGPPPPTGPPPSFSNAPPRQQKRQSVFRRSMAYLGGGGNAAQSAAQYSGGQSSGGPGAGSGPQTRPGQQQRRSLFRRSMALLTANHGGGSGNQQQGRGMPPLPPAPISPLPRVQGLQDDYEKPDHPRKSQYLGAGGSGAEWDLQGEGAKFWRRFSVAQKAAHTSKVEEGSKAWLASTKKGKRKLALLSTLTLLVLVGVIVGAIVWREIVSPSGNASSEPESSYKANLAAKPDLAGTTTTTTTTNGNVVSPLASTSDANSTGSLSRRSPVQEIMHAVHVHSTDTDDTPNHNAKRSHLRLRRRHFGQPATPLSPRNT